MKDKDRTKEQLIDELSQLRRLVARLEAQAKQSDGLKGEYRQADAERDRLMAVEPEPRTLTEALHQAGILLGGTLDYEKVLDLIMEQISQVVSYKAACVMLVERKTIHIFRWHGYTRNGVADSLASTPFDVNDISILRTRQETGWLLVTNDVADDDEWVASSGQNWIKSYLNVPIQTEVRLIGFLHVDSNVPGFYSRTDAERLEALANLAAPALENARRYDRARQEIAKRVKALKKERNFVSAILDTAGALVVVLDPEGRIVRFNRACERTTGYSSDEVQGRQVWDLFLTSEELESVRNVLERLHSGQFPIEYETHWVTKDGECRLIAWSNTVLFDNEGLVEHIISTGIDITERKRSEEEREKLIEELDAFARTVAHDLQGPLSVVTGFASSLMEYHPTMSDVELREHTEAIMRNGRKMRNIIKELLLLAGVRKQEVALEPLDMASIVAETQQRLAYMIDEHQAEIILPDTWPVALGYGPWIEEVWANYLSNAIKYGGQPPQVELGAAAQADGTVRFWIRDNGPGVTPEDQTRLFTPFTRLNQVRAKGQGLGLSIVRRIVEKLDGQVGVESDGVSGQGSRFSFTLPGAVSE